MKYIRTEDGIYEALRESETKKSYITKKSGLVIHKDKVINQADTIEELCDEFVLKWNKNEFPYSTLRQFERIGGYGDLQREIRNELNYGKYLNQDYEIYGCMWTDKGLKYVAKLNDKGELELL